MLQELFVIVKERGEFQQLTIQMSVISATAESFRINDAHDVVVHAAADASEGKDAKT